MSEHRSSWGQVHPLDVDLADLVDGTVDETRLEQLETHLAHCLLCRIKRQRLRRAPPPPPAEDATSLPRVTFAAPHVDEGGRPASLELWVAGEDDRTLVVVLRPGDGGRVLVAPVTLDVEAADEETVLIGADRSSLGLPLAVHPALATELPEEVLAARAGSLAADWESGSDALRAAPVERPDDPRLQLRQHLADRLASLDEVLPDPVTAADAPPARPEQVRSSFVAGLRVLRGDACHVHPREDWGDALLASAAGWTPLVTIDEVGIVLVVLDTPHGLVDDGDFDAARSVLTRFNATALVVLARPLSDYAEVFDAASLNHGIDLPSGAYTPPRPLIAGIAPLDAVAKFLDQHTGARTLDAPPRGPLARVDVEDVLREAAAAVVADAVRQGARFKIAPKRRGYESLAGADPEVAAALGRAFTESSVVEELLNLARAPRSEK